MALAGIGLILFPPFIRSFTNSLMVILKIWWQELLYNFVEEENLRDHLLSAKDFKPTLCKVYHGMFLFCISNHENCFLLNHFNLSFERLIKNFVINYISLIIIRPDEGLLLASFFLTGLNKFFSFCTYNFVTFVNFVDYMFIKIKFRI